MSAEGERARFTAADRATQPLADPQELISGLTLSDVPQEAARACLRLLEDYRRELAKPAGRDPGAAVHPDPPVESALQRFGRFEILQELGRGGHGVVYRAWDPVLQRQVALKIPRPETLASVELSERFQRESQIVGRLSHPHLVAVYEFGRVGPAFYIASQYCSGPSLAAWIKAHPGPIHVSAAVELVATLAETVDYVHGHGILHRDIKPANVLLEPRLDHGRSSRSRLEFVPKLTDFGLARCQDGAGGATLSGTIAGTPAYMAPEQAAGFLDRIGPAADVYSLGAVLYELLTGRPPFLGESDLDTLRRVGEGDLTPPRRLRAEVPRDLEAICLKSLDTEPTRRYPTAGELAADLNRFLAGEPVAARRIGPWGHFLKWSRRRPRVAQLSVALAFTACVAFVSVTWQWRRAAANYQLARAHQLRAEETLRQAHQSVRSFQDAAYEGDTYDAPEYQPLRRDLLQTAVGHYRALLAQKGHDPAIRADLADALYHLGFVHASLRESREAIRLLEEAARLWEGLRREQLTQFEHDRYLAKTWNLLGLQYYDTDQLEAALEAYQTALALHEDLLRACPDDPRLQDELALICHQFGSLQHVRGADAEALALLQRACRIRQHLVEQEPEPPQRRLRLGETHVKLALVKWALDQPADGLEDAFRATAILEELVEREQHLPRSADLLSVALRLLTSRQSLAQSEAVEAVEAHLRRAVELFKRRTQLHPAEMPSQIEWANCLRRLALVHAKQGRLSEAQTEFDEARRLQARLVEDDPGDSALAGDLVSLDYTIAKFQQDCGHYHEALHSLERAAGLAAAWHFNGRRFQQCREPMRSLAEQIVRQMGQDSHDLAVEQSLHRIRQAISSPHES